MSTKLKVAVAGASGTTGSSIVNALLETPDKFEITALARPASVGREVYTRYAERGVLVKPVELDGPSDLIVQSLVGADVVISCMTLWSRKEEMALISAASEAHVGRFVPSFFATCCPPRGVMMLREMKEDFLDQIKRLYLPYTAIDVGWWYQISLPPLPSKGLQAKDNYRTARIIGDGNTAWALTDNRDIGKYVARIIADPRTLNKMVFAYGQVRSQNEAFDALERLSGESIERIHATKEDLEAIISESQKAIAENGTGDTESMTKLAVSQYRYSLGVRGDDSPEHAKYLGYLDAKDLYPDVEVKSLEDYIQEQLAGEPKIG